MPTIGTVYCWNLMLTLFALCLHCIFHFLITILLPDTKCLPEQLKNLSSILNRFQAKELVVLSFDPQTLGSNNQDELPNPLIPLEDTSDLNQSPQQFIIEMDPIIIETDSSDNTQLKLQQQPSTSAQFEAVELEEIPQQQKTIENPPPPSTTKSTTLKRTSSSKKSLLSFGSGVFKSKEAKNEKRIDAPFSINLNFEGEKKIENSEEKEEEDDQQILINKEEKLEEDDGRRKNILEEKKVENKEEEKSILEKELMFLRQLIFYFYLIVSIILIFIIIF
ncbi:unnamed protein product [Meloidogyne enterolobii]|uniref:Uncharacterized protein n=1 Tax=Meloidogyne enterolobii TaxID=390850 RepID=A0ACB1AZY7_MELEN